MNRTNNHAECVGKHMPKDDAVPVSAMPKNIMLDKWADIGFAWSGEVPVSSFERLSEQVEIESGDQIIKVQVALKKTNGILWLGFDVMGQLMVSCQRCLEPMAVDVTGEYRLAVLFDETLIEQLQDAEYILVSELNAGKMSPIKDLLEDELLLILPLSLHHDDCDMPIEMTKNGNDDEGRENPFLVLASLKSDLN